MFFFFLPYRVKNPPKAFPYVTVALLAVNVLVFLLTSEYALVIRESVAENWGLSQANASLRTLFSHMFLHAHLLHLASNMLFLWIFGAAVEGRLGPLFYAVLYLLMGLAGGLAHQLLGGVVDPLIPLVGASGAIFGLAGAYLYLSPFAHIMVAYCVWAMLKGWAGAISVAAQWVILFYGVTNLAEGMLFRDIGGGGVANFAHLGGLVGGFLVMLATGMKRESEEYSNAQAVKADSGGHLMSMPLYELEALLDGPEPSPEVLITYLRKALTSHEGAGQRLASETLKRHANWALAKTDPESLADVALALSSDYRMPASWTLRLAGRLESVGCYDHAARAYRAIGQDDVLQNAPETETALMRLARLTEQTDPDKAPAAAIYAELLRRFPDGPQSAFARAALARLPRPAAEFSFSRGTVPAAPQPGGLGTVGTAGDGGPVSGGGHFVAAPGNAAPQMPTTAPVAAQPAPSDDAPQMPGIVLAPVGSHNPPTG